MTDLQGKVALVTGASRGIGKAIAEKLLERGATVVGTATSENGAGGIAEYLGDKGMSGVLDVSSQESVEALLSKVSETYGGIDILVNNAGVTGDNLLLRMKENEWQSILDTNLTSIFRMSKGVLRGMMKKRAGRIINIGSVVGSSGNPGQTNYCAAKAGLVGFSKSLAREVATRGITVNVVAPGFIETDMTDKLNEEQRKAFLKDVPADRLGKPSEIAAAVAFLASPDAAYITGETIHVNGGLFMG